MRKIELSEETGLPDWVLLEFQGDFEHSAETNFDAMELGDLRQLKSGAYEFIVGNQLLKGKTAGLPKPLLVTNKVRSVNPNDSE